MRVVPVLVLVLVLELVMTAEHKLARQPVEIGMMLLMKSRDMYMLMEDHTLTRAIKVCLDSLGNKIGQKLFRQTLVFFLVSDR